MLHRAVVRNMTVLSRQVVMNNADVDVHMSDGKWLLAYELNSYLTLFCMGLWKNDM